MKYLSIIALSLILFSCNGKVKTNQSKATSQKEANKIEVIDFHSTHRCMTCKAIEANTKYTLKTYFANEISNGKITFQLVNVDDEKNYKMAEQFEATGTALFLNVIINGVEKHIDLTDFAFMKGMEKEAFAEELKSKLEAELKNI
ncbi:MAG: nitrophenyl compound nitroreductase subunit ArsF family protein [Lutibacter sp.]|uniref:nitrophenyl compound nitroreductase subunit ArsF family protein n=1 Tax=Lutibacter sp. TaxID=1925666 RepID=UPI00299DED86|nr:nitrophenyl compound nitroreductase subunit ArsF family protein [Lutibacter sp.]MDX1828491.1 nitrophenyl compound nitroreductase subunit ArsF family protein [Lutibacter sp.]